LRQNQKKTLFIRADGGVLDGAGHITRMIALAQSWRKSGGDTHFLCAEITPNLKSRILNEKISLEKVQSASGSLDDLRKTYRVISRLGLRNTTVVLDGYRFGAEYQRCLKDAGCRILLMDDFGHSEFYYADWVLNQNHLAQEGAYTRRAPYTRLLLGTKYALLRREFEKFINTDRKFPKIATKVLVTLGGVDSNNLTGLVIEALRGCSLNLKVVIGGGSAHLEKIRAAIKKIKAPDSRPDLVVDTSRMPELMKWADLAVAAGGSTAWELCFMGVPSLYLISAQNQQPVAVNLDKDGLGVCLPRLVDRTDLTALAQQVLRLSNDQKMRKKMSKKCRALVDGHGSERVVQILQKNHES